MRKNRAQHHPLPVAIPTAFEAIAEGSIRFFALSGESSFFLICNRPFKRPFLSGG